MDVGSEELEACWKLESRTLACHCPASERVGDVRKHARIRSRAVVWFTCKAHAVHSWSSKFRSFRRRVFEYDTTHHTGNAALPSTLRSTVVKMGTSIR